MLFEKSAPAPPQKLADKGLSKEVHSALTDSRRERKARLCCRYFVGATETLQNKKVD